MHSLVFASYSCAHTDQRGTVKLQHSYKQGYCFFLQKHNSALLVGELWHAVSSWKSTAVLGKCVHLIESQQPELVWEKGILHPEDAKVGQEIRSGVGTTGWRRRMCIRNFCRTLLPKSEGLWGDLLAVQKYLKAGCKENRARPFSVVPSDIPQHTHCVAPVNFKVLLVFFCLWLPTILLVLIQNSQTSSTRGFHGQASTLSDPFFL